MQTNYTLKQAVKAAIGICAICAQTNVYALNNVDNWQEISNNAGESSSLSYQFPPLQMDTQLQFKPENIALPTQNAAAGDIGVQEKVVQSKPQAQVKSQVKNQVIAQQTATSFITENFIRDKLNWLGLILGLALLYSSASIINKWRLRRKQTLFEQTQFSPTIQGLHVLNETNQHDGFFDFDKDQAFNEAFEDTTQHFDIFDDFNEPEPEAKALFSANSDEKLPSLTVEKDGDNDIVDHADVFLSHGRTNLAIELLQNHLINHPKKSVTEWLFLLDLLAKENMQAMYEQTALECKEHFNIRIGEFSNDEGTAKNSLEDFPRLVAGLAQVWGTPAARVFLDDLIYNSRLEARIGFEKPVIEELLLLKSITHSAVSTAQVIQLDDKKMALQAQKEAKIAAIKEDRIKKVNELIESKLAEARAQENKNKNEDSFEFSLVDYN